MDRMRRTQWHRILTVTVILAAVITAIPAVAQDERLVPSYSEDSGYIRDYPGVDIDVHPFIGTWKGAPVTVGHGGFAIQPILTPGDPVNPPRKGAVLKYITAYDHGFLYGNDVTAAVRHDDRQVIVFVMEGVGRVEAGGRTADLSEGSGVFIPAGLEYRFANTSGKAMEVIIIEERIPEGFTPKTQMVVRNWHDAVPGYCCWAYVTHSLFGADDGLAEPMGIMVVTVDGFGMGSPHFHVPGCEEIWCKISGEPNPTLIGKTLVRQEIGEAFLPPPNGLVPHAVINPTESRMAWLYLGNRHDKE